jgi:hypothetical protein
VAAAAAAAAEEEEEEEYGSSRILQRPNRAAAEYGSGERQGVWLFSPRFVSCVEASAMPPGENPRARGCDQRSTALMYA